MKPKFKKLRSQKIYEILKRLYFICIFAYIPLLMVFTLFDTLRADGGFIDFGYWLPFLLFLFCTFPCFAFFASFGISLNGFLAMKTRTYHHPKIQRIYGVTCFASFLMMVISALSLFIDALQKIFIVPMILALAVLLLLLVLYLRLRRYFICMDDPDEIPQLTLIKNIITLSIVILSVLAILFIPYETIRFADGGTVMTRALAYTVVDWNRGKNADSLVLIDQKDLQYAEEEQTTCVYFFPDNFKSYQELWDIKH